MVASIELLYSTVPVYWLEDGPLLRQLYKGGEDESLLGVSQPHLLYSTVPVYWLKDGPLLRQLYNGGEDEALLGVSQPHPLTASTHPRVREYTPLGQKVHSLGRA